MAAGPGATTAHGGPGSFAAFKTSVERRFQGVSNTMESIQGLSAWCIENKKHHSLVVRSWMKCLRKSEATHRLNLFYLANDVIQNCRRKNAIVYRTSFAEVLPAAVLLVRDSKVRKSVERTLAIWNERKIYPEEFISDLEASLASKAAPAALVNSKASLKAKIVAEFVPSAFRQQLSVYKRSLEEVELKEKQLAALGMDICSTQAFKKLKDKAGGKKFSKEFEDSSKKFQDFVGFLEQQVKEGRPLVEALSNADMFYEMQYKEVKIIAKAYMSFASRVSNVKQKLDTLKSTLPSLYDSPVPSPCEDAPSPAGSESPIHTINCESMEHVASTAVHRDTAMGQALTASHGDWDNRNVEDMDLSEGEEAESTDIIVEEQTKSEVSVAVGEAGSVHGQVPTVPERANGQQPSKNPILPLPLDLAHVDLAKINSILSNLTSVMKGTRSSNLPLSRPGLEAPNSGGPAPASLLPQADTSPQGLLSALSKVQGQSGKLSHQHGISESTLSLAGSCAPGSTSSLLPEGKDSPEAFSAVGGISPGHTLSEPKLSMGNDPRQNLNRLGVEETSFTLSSSSASLEDKISKFLQGNPLFSSLNGSGVILGSGSPYAVTEKVDGTPLRDEAGGTPTLDEVVDESVVGLVTDHHDGTGSGRARPLGTESRWSLPPQSVPYQSVKPWVTSLPYGERSPMDSLGGSHHETVRGGMQSSGSCRTVSKATWAPMNGSEDRANLGGKKAWSGEWTLEDVYSHTDNHNRSPGNSSSVNLGSSSSAQAPLQSGLPLAQVSPGGRPALYPGEATPHHPPPSNFLNTPLPPIPQLPPPPKDFVTSHSQVMVDGTASDCAALAPQSRAEKREPAGGDNSGFPKPLPPWVGRGVGTNSKNSPLSHASTSAPAWSGGPPTHPPEHIQPRHPRPPHHSSASYRSQLQSPLHHPHPVLSDPSPFDDHRTPLPTPPRFCSGPRRVPPGPPFCPPKRPFLPPNN